MNLHAIVFFFAVALWHLTVFFLMAAWRMSRKLGTRYLSRKNNHSKAKDNAKNTENR